MLDTQNEPSRAYLSNGRVNIVLMGSLQKHIMYKEFLMDVKGSFVGFSKNIARLAHNAVFSYVFRVRWGKRYVRR